MNMTSGPFLMNNHSQCHYTTEARPLPTLGDVYTPGLFGPDNLRDNSMNRPTRLAGRLIRHPSTCIISAVVRDLPIVIFGVVDVFDVSMSSQSS